MLLSRPTCILEKLVVTEFHLNMITRAPILYFHQDGYMKSPHFHNPLEIKKQFQL